LKQFENKVKIKANKILYLVLELNGGWTKVKVLVVMSSSFLLDFKISRS